MNGPAVFLVLSLMTRSRVAFDDQHHGYPKPATTGQEPHAVTTRYGCSPRERVSRHP